MALQEIKVPDLEGAENVGVVEVYIGIGDTVEIETALISLESDKAVMDVPSPISGVIKELKVSEGDTVNSGDVIAIAETAAEDSVTEETAADASQAAESPKSPEPAAETQSEETVEIHVPDLEGSTDVAVVEVYVSVGDEVEAETPLISLESDKAVMDVPSPVSGRITELKVSEGDSVNTGDLIAMALSSSPGETKPSSEKSAEPSETVDSGTQKTDAPAQPAATAAPPVNAQKMGSKSHATPSVRSFARELGVELAQVTGSGPKGRVTREDVSSLVKKVMSGAPASAAGIGGSFSLPPIPTADFAAFGEIEVEDLSRIKKISGPHLHRNWVGIPHVTQFEDADITELEAFRKDLNAANAKSGDVKISPLIFIIKAAVQALKEFPDFNSSLGPDGTTIIRKKYINIGVAVDTPGGLMVPVIKDADKKGVLELAETLGDLSLRAREGKLKGDELKGGTFSISSLGGIGGTYFTPIVNAPEVAILGLSKSAMKPVWNGKEFEPRLILPFSLSYDHRVVDGASGARFAHYLSQLLADMRRALL